MTDLIEIHIPRFKYNEGASFTATAYFRDRATVTPDTPTTAEYKIENLTTGNTVQDWTSLTPGESVSFTITGTNNTLSGSYKREQIQLIVSADRGLSTQTIGQVMWSVENLML